MASRESRGEQLAGSEHTYFHPTIVPNGRELEGKRVHGWVYGSTPECMTLPNKHSQVQLDSGIYLP